MNATRTDLRGTAAGGRRLRIAVGQGLALGLLLTGCAAVGPDYQRVEPAAPAAWHGALSGGLESESADREALARWWTLLEDPLLTSLEDRAVRGNLDLKRARARLGEARARRGLSRAGLYPTVGVGAAATKSRSSENSGSGREIELYRAGFDAGWELDVFGGVRRSVEAADADLAASTEALRDVLVSLTAEVGLNYVDVRAYQARLAAARSNLDAQRDTYDLNASRYTAGLIDELPVQQARYNLERTRSQIPQLERGLAAVMNRLAVLLGEAPGALAEQLAPPGPVPAVPLTVAVGIPAEALRRRPDVRRAERELAAQSARIGVATADLYPHFRLFGSIGLESLELGDLVTWPSRTFAVGPSVSWRLFDAGAVRRNIEVQNARQEQALLGYQAAVLGALEEVENGLVAFAKVQERRDALARATEAAGRADQVARDRYRAGLVDFSNVLDAQRSLLGFQDELAQSQGAVATELVRLYKALGGGWGAEGAPGLPVEDPGAKR
ncbi:MAG TPA: efflux transporter outer membrane subunit [Deferrisomatales bacterium]|nr:efflux transporter outer membrane subunit [Deferrisomatales bacterium]